MAYGNWGGMVFKDGVRQPNREDNTPYREEGTPSGYWQAFSSLRPQHVSLGDGPVRWCGYKAYPNLFFFGITLYEDLRRYRRDQTIPSWREWGWWDTRKEGLDGEVPIAHDGEPPYTVRFVAVGQDDPDGLTLWLVQRDVVWAGFCGYGIGAGYDDAVPSWWADTMMMEIPTNPYPDSGAAT